MTLEDFTLAAKDCGFAIPKGSHNEVNYLLLANSFDAVCRSVQDFPDYHDPRLAPTPVEGGERKYHRPEVEDNPLNAWAHKVTLVSSDPKAREGPLKGRTVVVKDNVSVAGLPLGLGCSPKLLKGDKHPISTIDATVVKRILEAGGTINGIATCENLSMFAMSFTSDRGVVHNAWLPGYATGGSSSGCGALVSIADVEVARKDGKNSTTHPLGEGVELAVGGDQGGSIRLPSAYSGIYGLKPTHGLVPYTGIAGLNPMIDHTGPMARSVEDIAMMLGVMAGYDGIDLRMTPESPTLDRVPDYSADLKAWIAEKEKSGEWTKRAAAKGLRVGVLKESLEVLGLDPEITATIKQAANRFRDLGAEVTEVSIPMHKQGPSLWTVAGRSQLPLCIENQPADLLTYPMPDLDPKPIGQNFFDVLANRNPAVVNVVMNAAFQNRRYGPALARKAIMNVWELRAAYDGAFEDVDVLLTPINPTVGPPMPKGSLKTDSNPDGNSERIMDLFEPVIGNTLNLCGFNVTGHPGMSMPVGWGKIKDGEGKLPVGMQLVAKRFNEAVIFRACKAWEMGGRWQDS